MPDSGWVSAAVTRTSTLPAGSEGPAGTTVWVTAGASVSILTVVLESGPATPAPDSAWQLAACTPSPETAWLA